MLVALRSEELRTSPHKGVGWVPGRACSVNGITRTVGPAPVVARKATVPRSIDGFRTQLCVLARQNAMLCDLKLLVKINSEIAS